MAKFAVEANKAANALSSTTKKYTDAALIFYQQGLGTEDVKERTDATIKMANVTGEAVDEVSSYMTAVWNNFNKDGTQSVEHYGDIMTKLGAETAATQLILLSAGRAGNSTFPLYFSIISARKPTHRSKAAFCSGVLLSKTMIPPIMG